MNIEVFDKHFVSGNRTVFIDHYGKTMIVVYLKDLCKLTDICFDNAQLISKNDRYTKFTTNISNAMCEYLIIQNYTYSDYTKHVNSNKQLLKETPEYYRQTILPNAIKSDKTWIYNILDGNAELDRIIFQNNDFILLKDIKWSGEILNDIHLLVLLKRKDLLSIRDIDDSNITLIQQIDDVTRNVIFQTYGINKNKIRSYFHYHPSYWHLHIHYDLYDQSTISTSVDYCKLLCDVVENVKIDNNYYKKITLNVIEHEII